MEKLFQQEMPFPKIIRLKYTGETKETPVYIERILGLSGTGVQFGNEVVEVTKTLLEHGDEGNICFDIKEKEPTVFFLSIFDRAKEICDSRNNRCVFVGNNTSRLSLISLLGEIVIIGFEF